MTKYLDYEGLQHLCDRLDFRIKSKRNEVKNILHGPIRVNRINNKYFLKNGFVNIKIPANKGGNTYKYNIEFIKSINHNSEITYFDNVEIFDLSQYGYVIDEEQQSFPIVAKNYLKHDEFANGQNIHVRCKDFPLFGSYKIIYVDDDEETPGEHNIRVGIYVREEYTNRIIYNSTNSVAMINGDRVLIYQPTIADVKRLEYLYGDGFFKNFKDRRIIIYYRKKVIRGNLSNNLRKDVKTQPRYVYRRVNVDSPATNSRRVFKSRTNLYKMKLYNKRLRAKSNFTTVHLTTDTNTSRFKRVDIL